MQNPSICDVVGAFLTHEISSEDECINEEGNDESVIKNYEFFGEEWDG